MSRSGDGPPNKKPPPAASVRRAPSSSFPARLHHFGATQQPAGSAPNSPAAILSVPAGVKKVLRPQRPLHEAAADLARRATPQGLGLDSQRVRQAMAQRLQQLGIQDARVLAAISDVPRHVFVDTALANQAYEDTSLPIGLGQTISKPSIVARMIELLCARPGTSSSAAKPLGRVLEIGSGCGYQAAVLAQLAQQVVSIERLRGLHDRARENLRALPSSSGIRLILGDGMLGYAGLAPFDTIVAAAGGHELPQAWLDQLACGGRLVAPVHAPQAGPQMLVVVDRGRDGALIHRVYESVHFVPLKSGVD